MAPIDWQTRKTLSECTKYLLDNTINCDVNFKVGGNKEIIKAHRFILSMRSAVFEKMFHGSFCESGKDSVVLDVSAAALHAVLRYCYYDCTDIQDDIALSLLYASTKYMLPLLEEAARKKVNGILGSPKYIWDVYKYAVDVGDTELLDACRKYFKGDVTPVREALQAEAFLKIPQNVLLDFLHINDEVDESLLIHENQMIKEEESDPEINSVAYQNCIGISISEIELFRVCRSWAEAECIRQAMDTTGANKRKVLGECLFLIRFPTMLPKDLANIVYPTRLLTPDEIISLGRCVYMEPVSDCETNFRSKERKFVATALLSTPDYSKSSIYIESGERVCISRLWMTCPGSYAVILKDTISGKSQSSRYGTHFENHSAKVNICEYWLYYIDIEPHILEAGTRYSVTVDRKDCYGHPDKIPDMKEITIDQLAHFKELKVSTSPGHANLYALTLCLV